MNIIQQASKLQFAYLSAKDALGIEHPVVKALWAEYLRVDEQAHEIRIEQGKRMMQDQQDQIDNMDESDMAFFRMMTD